MRLHIVGSLVLVAALASGCVIGRRTVGLSAPVLPTAGVSKGEASVVRVTDNRSFQNKPSDPSIPSIDGDVNSLTPEEKASMIGRQRNTYGKAMGDIALPAGQSVPQQVRELVEAALRARGYNVTNNPSAATTLNVSIDQFWAWSTPGFFSLGFEARVYCALTVTQDGKRIPLMVQGYGKNSGQVASDANWKEAYDRAFKDFLDKLIAELGRAGF